MGGRVEYQPAAGDQWLGLGPLAAGQGPYSRREFVEIEGLDQVVVGAGIEARTRSDGVAGGEGPAPGWILAGSQAGEHLDAVAARRAEVEQISSEGVVTQRQFRGDAVAYQSTT